MSFKNKQVLITGGSGGLGALLTRQFVGDGAQVTVLDRAEPSAGVKFIRADLSTADGLEAAASAVAGGDWDVLVNLAGIQHFGPLEREAPAHLVASYLVNLVAPVRLTQAVLPRMKARGRGQIVNVGSIFGSINFAHFVTYSSAKAGLRGFSRRYR